MKKILTILLLTSVTSFSQTELKYPDSELMVRDEFGNEMKIYPHYLNKRVRNVFTTGGDKWWGGIDFMATFGLIPGDTVVVPANLSIGHVEITNIDGIVFINEGGQATIKSFNLYPGAKNVKLLGNGVPGIQYGIKIQGTNFAINWEAVGSLEIGNVEIYGNAMGIKISTVPTTNYPLNYQSVYIHHSKITNVQQEGMYLGRDELGGPFITAKVFQNQVSTTGRDGIQCRNGVFEVTYNSISDVGRNGEGDHDDGLLFGGNTKGSVAKSNLIANGIRGNAIFCNGPGEFYFVQNTLSSNAPAIFTKSPIATEDLQRLGYQYITATGNIISSTSGIAIQSYKQNDYPIKINWCGNATTARTDIMAGITFDTTCSAPAPTPTILVTTRNEAVTITNPFIIIQTSVAGLKYEVYSVSTTPKLLFSGVTVAGETKINISKVTNKYFTVKVADKTYKVTRPV